MRSIRRDPTTGDLVVLAPERVSRPRALPDAGAHRIDPAHCPFCPGNEAAVPPPIDVRRDDDGQWTAFAVPNRFPALVVEDRLASRAHGPYDEVSGVGAHEVLVESRLHDVPLWEQPVDQLAAALGLARDRIRDLSGDDRMRHVAWFRNHGTRAGASQPHPHAQIVAMPFVPPLVQRMCDRADRHARERGRDLLQDVLDFERDAGERVVWNGGRIVAFCPWASAHPFETWLVPAAPGADFRQADDDLVHVLADAMRVALRGLAAQVDEVHYTASLFTAPFSSSGRGFRWHVRLQPRLEIAGGFDAATGCSINGVPPETAARLLRGE